jgi:hypothetical protein
MATYYRLNEQREVAVKQLDEFRQKNDRVISAYLELLFEKMRLTNETNKAYLSTKKIQQ